MLVHSTDELQPIVVINIQGVKIIAASINLRTNSH